MPDSVFALPAGLAPKADPSLVADDEAHFRLVAPTLDRSIADLTRQLEAERRHGGGSGQGALERDLEIHRLTARLHTLRRFSLDLCLGRITFDDAREPIYIGRLGLTDGDGRHLLVDWRTPAAEPFFAATLAHPAALATRRRYRWTGGRITDYWDEVFTPEGLERGGVSLDDESAFIASLGSSRSPRMRDVLGTIQADQDAIIRASARGPLVVDGGPGTGKTVVALHRAAYLIYSDPRLHRGDGGVLFVGPHEAYLAYVADVLPSLGEESVQTCTLRDLVAEGARAGQERDPDSARLKASAALLRVVDAAVAGYETPPVTRLAVDTPWGEAVLGRRDWADAFGAADPGSPHNDARDQVWDELLDILVDMLDVDEQEAPRAVVRRALAQDEELGRTFAEAWPLLDPVGVVADIWSVPAYLQQCAPWLSDREVRALVRDEPRAWTTSDLPFLDAARRRIGDPEAGRRRRRREATIAAERERRQRVVDELIAADDSELLLMHMLRGDDARNSLDDPATVPAADPDLLAGPFEHVVVDEAQELTDAEWQMLRLRCPSRSATIVGDRAQARHGFAESWQDRLDRAGFGPARVATLTINYRTPEEVMAAAEPMIRAALPDANVPVSVRASGIPVTRRSRSDLDAVLADWLATHDEGIACVIGDPARRPTARIRSLTPVTAKGLEFDLVVLVDPDALGDGIEGAVDRYVSATRATQQLVIVQ